jgi:hypothetical protein
MTNPLHIITSTVRGGGVGGRAWVAKLTGHDEKWGFVREFVRKQSHTSKSGRSGSIDFPITEPGIYEFRDVQPARGDATIGDLASGFLRVEADGTIAEIDKDAVQF